MPIFSGSAQSNGCTPTSVYQADLLYEVRRRFQDGSAPGRHDDQYAYKPGNVGWSDLGWYETCQNRRSIVISATEEAAAVRVALLSTVYNVIELPSTTEAFVMIDGFSRRITVTVVWCVVYYCNRWPQLLRILSTVIWRKDVFTGQSKCYFVWLLPQFANTEPDIASCRLASKIQYGAWNPASQKYVRHIGFWIIERWSSPVCVGRTSIGLGAAENIRTASVILELYCS